MQFTICIASCLAEFLKKSENSATSCFSDKILVRKVEGYQTKCHLHPKFPFYRILSFTIFQLFRSELNSTRIPKPLSFSFDTNSFRILGVNGFGCDGAKFCIGLHFNLEVSLIWYNIPSIWHFVFLNCLWHVSTNYKSTISFYRIYLIFFENIVKFFY